MTPKLREKAPIGKGSPKVKGESRNYNITKAISGQADLTGRRPRLLDRTKGE